MEGYFQALALLNSIQDPRHKYETFVLLIARVLEMTYQRLQTPPQTSDDEALVDYARQASQTALDIFLNCQRLSNEAIQKLPIPVKAAMQGGQILHPEDYVPNKIVRDIDAIHQTLAQGENYSRHLYHTNLLDQVMRLFQHNLQPHEQFYRVFEQNGYQFKAGF